MCWSDIISILLFDTHYPTEENMLLYIIRHGETDYNAKGVLQGRMDAPLNESGRSREFNS